MLNMSVEDIHQKYNNSVVMIDGAAKYVTKVISDEFLRVTDLRTQATEDLAVSPRNLKSPERIGFVNLFNSVIYGQRNSMRIMRNGLCKENVEFKVLECPSPKSKGTVLAHARTLYYPELADALENIYPDLKVALRRAKQHNGTVAFDKQFAVDCNGDVWYKIYKVGKVVKGAVVFDDSAASLSCLLGDYNADA